MTDENIRNIGKITHFDCDKSALSERILEIAFSAEEKGAENGQYKETLNKSRHTF